MNKKGLPEFLEKGNNEKLSQFSSLTYEGVSTEALKEDKVCAFCKFKTKFKNLSSGILCNEQ